MSREALFVEHILEISLDALYLIWPFTDSRDWDV